MREARAAGTAADSDAATAIAERFLVASAAASGKTVDDAFRERMRKTQDPRAQRYWELVAIMKGEPLSPRFADGQWLATAIARVLER